MHSTIEETCTYCEICRGGCG